jgi:hypothetical protein
MDCGKATSLGVWFESYLQSCVYTQRARDDRSCVFNVLDRRYDFNLLDRKLQDLQCIQLEVVWRTHQSLIPKSPYACAVEIGSIGEGGGLDRDVLW